MNIHNTTTVYGYLIPVSKPALAETLHVKNRDKSGSIGRIGY